MRRLTPLGVIALVCAAAAATVAIIEALQ